jgi:CelD/BcsL family acetyltransferase involved in cellulose biosynthesis
MQLTDGENVLIADDADRIARAAVRLASDETLWNRLSAHGVDNVRQHFSAAAAAATLQRVLSDASNPHAKRQAATP